MQLNYVLIQVRLHPPAARAVPVLPPRQVSETIFHRRFLMTFNDAVPKYIMSAFTIKNMIHDIIERYDYVSLMKT